MNSPMLPPWTLFIISPLICGLIGWATNRIAVKMLFRPHTPRRVLGVTFQGVFPKRQAALAENLGRMVAQELISHEDVTAFMRDPAFMARFHNLAEEYVDTLLDDRLPATLPMATMFLTDKVKPRLKQALTEQLDSLAPKFLDVAVDELERNFDVQALVRDKVAAFSMQELETMLESLMKREFRFIERLGGVLGAIIGLLQAAAYLLLT